MSLLPMHETTVSIARAFVTSGLEVLLRLREFDEIADILNAMMDDESKDHIAAELGYERPQDEDS